MENKKGFYVTVGVLALMIAITGIVLVYYSSVNENFKIKQELIFGGGGILFGLIGIFMSIRSAMIAEEAKEDAKVSSQMAIHTVELAIQEAERSKIRYRNDKGPLLVIQKDEMYIPLLAPSSFKQVHHIVKPDSLLNYRKLTLTNRGLGTAKAIYFQLEFTNTYLFDGYTYGTDDIKESSSLYQQHLMNELYPSYWIYSKNNDRDTPFPKIMVKTSDNSGTYDPQYFKGLENKSSSSYGKNQLTLLQKRIRSLQQECEYIFHLPSNYRLLAQHFFLEQLMELNPQKRKAPNPRLRLRVDYIDEVLEHLNEEDGGRRVKIFEITCSESVSLVDEPSDSPHLTHKEKMMSCFFDIDVVYDLPFLEAQILEETLAHERNIEADLFRGEKRKQKNFSFEKEQEEIKKELEAKKKKKEH